MQKSQMDLRAQVGQLLIMGLEGHDPGNDTVRTLRELQPGGVILFARNIKSPVQCHDLVAACRKAADVPLFTCVDLEGGQVDRFREIIAPAPSQNRVASTCSRSIFRKFGELLGTEARTMGFNTDFAPVSDIGFAASRSVLGTRTVSESPEETVVFVREFLRGLKSANVLGCGKHFPGLGEGNLDSHFALPNVNKSWKRLWTEDLLPYRSLHRQFPFVMVAHATYPDVNKDGLPSSLSHKWVSDILRRKIGYRGLILSDDLEMSGALAAGDIQHAAIECMRAGSDMFLVCHKESAVLDAYEAVLREAEKDKRFARTVAQAADRVMAYKKRARELKGFSSRPTAKTIARLRAQFQIFEKQLAKAGAKK